jgi:hypothetical protein
VPSARDLLIESHRAANEALRAVARRHPNKVRSLLRDFPGVLGDLGLPPWQGRGRPKGSVRVLQKKDAKDLLIERALALGLKDSQICRDLGRKYNSASRRYIKRAVERVRTDALFDRMRTQIADRYQTRQHVGAALRELRRR